MATKHQELAKAFYSSDFPPAKTFYQVKKDIESSRVFQTIRRLPKGGILHVHDFGMTSVEWVIQNVTYRDNLYMCIDNATDSLKFGWFTNPPQLDAECLWMNVKDTRTLLGDESVDQALKKHLNIMAENPSEAYPNINSVWDKFNKVFGALFSLLSYVPVTKDYFYQAFTEFMEDNVQYLEFRTVLPSLCPNMDNCDDGTSAIETGHIFKEVAEKFLRDHPNDFCDIRMIYAPIRYVMAPQVETYLEVASQLKVELGDFMVGFDLVGQEDKGKPLIDFVPLFLEKLHGSDLKLFFHAGETDWQGQATDFNLFDAILLNATRIGHGYAITKHPAAKKMAIEKNIAIELCPISNQVLKLVDDLRNHPIVELIQDGNFPIVIAPDDPGLWDAKGISYDFYEAFMGMASATMDLRLIKKLALNSIDYTTLDQNSKASCMNMFNSKWNGTVKSMLPIAEPNIDLI